MGSHCDRCGRECLASDLIESLTAGKKFCLECAQAEAAAAAPGSRPTNRVRERKREAILADDDRDVKTFVKAALVIGFPLRAAACLILLSGALAGLSSMSSSADSRGGGCAQVMLIGLLGLIVAFIPAIILWYSAVFLHKFAVLFGRNVLASEQRV